LCERMSEGVVEGVVEPPLIKSRRGLHLCYSKKND
jgi:hypothetical protein